MGRSDLARVGATALAAVLCAACGGLGGGSEDGGQPFELRPGLEQDVVVSGLTAPTAFAFLPDGRILIAEQSGLVWIVVDGRLREEPFLDLSHEVNAFRERGLLGLAVDPEFEANGFVYLLYSYEDDPDLPKHTKTGRLTRVTADGDTAVPGSDVVVLGSLVGPSCERFPAGSDCIPQDWMGHAVGDLEFAPDGTLFVGIGDAANWNEPTEDALRAQDLDSLAGKVLRITRDGKGLASNPFWTGDPDANRSKVWAYGLRNPFRFSLSPWSGLPYVGDVGWERHEEIDVATPGANLGWPCYEGPERQPEFAGFAACRSLYARGEDAVEPPLLAWTAGERHDASVTGGVFATAAGGLPSELDGAYVFGDYVRGVIEYLHVDADDEIVSGPAQVAAGAEGPVDIRLGPDGALYYLSIVTGELRRIRAAAPAGEADGGRALFERPAVARSGANPHSVAAADVDGDGVLDLLAANAGGDSVSVLLGTGGGRLAPAVEHRTGARPKVVVAADLDGGGAVDLATANQDGNSASVLLGRGDGTFAPAVDYPTCRRAHDVAVADLDGDGALDLAVACFDGTVVSVLLGNGDGTFRGSVEHESGETPHSLVARDFDGDGVLDLAVANRGDHEVGVLIGTGDGGFREAVAYAVGRRPDAVRAGDLDRNGVPDLVTANDGSDDVSVLLGRGDGTFAKARSYPAGPVPKSVVVADLDGDGDDDVATSNTAGNYPDGASNPGGDTVSVLLGTGTGELAAARTYLAGHTPFSVAAADLDGDGLLDLATANWDAGTVSVLLGRGAG